MSRLCKAADTTRDVQERCLGKLGNCVVLIGMARERVRLAANVTNQHRLLDPADQDLEEVVSRILSAQADLPLLGTRQ